MHLAPATHLLGVLKVLESCLPTHWLAFSAGVCMQSMQLFVTSGLHLLHWKEFKPFTGCCPFLSKPALGIGIKYVMVLEKLAFHISLKIEF